MTDAKNDPEDKAGPIKRVENGGDQGPHGIGDEHETAKDMAYSPSSERETQASQESRSDADLEADGIDSTKVVAAPGTGGADDAGDVEPEPGDLHLPWVDDEK